MSTEPDVAYQKALEQYERLVATIAEVERKGATMPYTSVNGHMFSLLDKNGTVSLRLPPGAREEFIAMYDTELAVQYGRVRKEYPVVPSALLERTEELAPYFRASYDYVSSLKPKPTKKKKAK